ncbi:MAG TPA: MerR family transcriptional regulator [Cellulomonas sp.]|uniref:MerR family transcriptional regulator n=1 Tax=Cellulomonas sp. TaxID=40001 RepID=UPI002E34104F|nr:MerR family transcriptional regulator [Cellulomonas sp.]HEX5332469.1 MerR family transcriptional regulator [Cellulomonas sp.]
MAPRDGDDAAAPPAASEPVLGLVPEGPAATVTEFAPMRAQSRTPRQVPALTVAAVARRLGVAPATLRTWDRRYGLGPSAHAAGSHRRYTADDVDRLLVMRGLTIDGVAPSEAARLARESDAHDDRYVHAQPHGGPHHGGATGAGAGAVRASGALARGRTQEVTPTLVIDAALRGDEATCRALLAPPADVPVETWWLELVEPVRAGLAARTVLARSGEEADTIVVAAVLAALRSRSTPLARTHVAGRRVVLLLAAPEEPRPLSLHVLAAALAVRGVDARVVAGPVEPHRTVEIAAMTRPAAIVLVTERPDADLAVIGALATAQPDVPQFVVLPDGAAADLPLGRLVHRARSFTGLLHEVLAVST